LDLAGHMDLQEPHLSESEDSLYKQDFEEYKQTYWSHHKQSGQPYVSKFLDTKMTKLLIEPLPMLFETPKLEPSRPS
jgi:hypothetical protein